jgi:lipid II:glycine glycyltransferase (peptidoglycan interpeptide bridge formation enzyme)
MIQDAKIFGATTYDLLGIANPWDPSDPLMGVSQFKEKFWGTVVKLPEKKILPLSWKYIPFMMLYRMRKGLKRWI